MCGNPGDPFVGAIFLVRFPTSLNSEGGSGGAWKSETPIVAKNPGNAAGAKGSRFKIMVKGNMPRHRADSVHDNNNRTFHTMGADISAKAI